MKASHQLPDSFYISDSKSCLFVNIFLFIFICVLHLFIVLFCLLSDSGAGGDLYICVDDSFTCLFSTCPLHRHCYLGSNFYRFHPSLNNLCSSNCTLRNYLATSLMTKSNRRDWTNDLSPLRILASLTEKWNRVWFLEPTLWLIIFYHSRLRALTPYSVL